MSNGPVDTEQDYEDKPEEEEQGKPSTFVGFRVRSDQLLFFRRMADYFYNEGYIAEPKFSLLAKVALNIVANKYAKFEEVAMAEFVQRKIQQARGPNVVDYRQMHPQQQAQTLRKQPGDLIPPDLRRPSPVDKVKTPEWFS